MSPSGKPVVRPVLSGYLVRIGGTIMDASSSITIVESAGKRLIVDTGSPRELGRLMTALKGMNLRPETVDYVVNTHLHMDHCGCNHLFMRARLVAHELEFPPVGAMRIRDRTSLLPGVELVPTPGHSAGSMSVFVDGLKRTALAGDAIPLRENYENKVPPLINIDPWLAMKSMEVIWSWADTIVPGHDAPFRVLRKE